MKGTLRIGVAQMDCKLGDTAVNLGTMAGFVERAAADGVELLVFPELALTGYVLGESFADAAIGPDSPEVRRLRDLSRRTALVVGLIEETEKHEFFNSALFLNQGRVLHVHRKIYLPNYRMFDERRYFAVGPGIRSFDTPWGRMAVLICGDAWHLPVPYLAAHQGANVLLIIAASSREALLPSTRSEEAWEHLNRTYALMLSSFVVFSNRVGMESGLTFWGGSHVAMPDGNLGGRAAEDGPDLLVADLDFAQLRRQRLILPFRRDDSLSWTVETGRLILQDDGYRVSGFLREAIEHRRNGEDVVRLPGLADVPEPDPFAEWTE